LNDKTDDEKQQRESALRSWTAEQLSGPVAAWEAVSGDASFRRYFRVTTADTQWIAVDAPPATENNQAFITIAQWLSAFSRVPQVMAQDLEQGFLLLSDLGDELLWRHLNEHTADHFYTTALAALVPWQTAEPPAFLPVYDQAFIERELALFDEWFVEKLLQVTLTETERTQLRDVGALLVDAATTQPQVFMHRDYHSRNLMLLGAPDDRDNAELAVIDFQDAVLGPLVYDAVSLLKDCYIAWPREQVVEWLSGYYERLSKDSNRVEGVHFKQFLRWFDWVGLQRHLKVLGIFSRLYLRDGKAGYLDDLPRVWRYVLDMANHYPEFADLDALLRQKIEPAFEQWVAQRP